MAGKAGLPVDRETALGGERRGTTANQEDIRILDFICCQIEHALGIGAGETLLRAEQHEPRFAARGARMFKSCMAGLNPARLCDGPSGGIGIGANSRQDLAALLRTGTGDSAHGVDDGIELTNARDALLDV